MFLKRKTEGSVICASCGVLVGVNDDRCYNCGRRNPGLWGYGPALRSLGQDFGFVPLNGDFLIPGGFGAGQNSSRIRFAASRALMNQGPCRHAQAKNEGGGDSGC